MQNDSFKMRQHYAAYNRSEESHRKSAAIYALSLWWWDISLTLNMTYFFKNVILNVVKNPTEKVRQYMLYHFGGGIFR